jgi:hypothetical protein
MAKITAELATKAQELTLAREERDAAAASAARLVSRGIGGQGLRVRSPQSDEIRCAWLVIQARLGLTPLACPRCCTPQQESELTAAAATTAALHDEAQLREAVGAAEGEATATIVGGSAAAAAPAPETAADCSEPAPKPAADGPAAPARAARGNRAAAQLPRARGAKAAAQQAAEDAAPEATPKSSLATKTPGINEQEARAAAPLGPPSSGRPTRNTAAQPGWVLGTGRDWGCRESTAPPAACLLKDIAPSPCFLTTLPTHAPLAPPPSSANKRKAPEQPAVAARGGGGGGGKPACSPVDTPGWPAASEGGSDVWDAPSDSEDCSADCRTSEVIKLRKQAMEQRRLQRAHAPAGGVGAMPPPVAQQRGQAQAQQPQRGARPAPARSGVTTATAAPARGGGRLASMAMRCVVCRQACARRGPRLLPP